MDISQLSVSGGHSWPPWLAGVVTVLVLVPGPQSRAFTVLPPFLPSILIFIFGVLLNMLNQEQEGERCIVLGELKRRWTAGA